MQPIFGVCPKFLGVLDLIIGGPLETYNSSIISQSKQANLGPINLGGFQLIGFEAQNPGW